MFSKTGRLIKRMQSAANSPAGPGFPGGPGGPGNPSLPSRPEIQAAQLTGVC